MHIDRQIHIRIMSVCVKNTHVLTPTSYTTYRYVSGPFFLLDYLMDTMRRNQTIMQYRCRHIKRICRQHACTYLLIIHKLQTKLQQRTRAPLHQDNFFGPGCPPIHVSNSRTRHCQRKRVHGEVTLHYSLIWLLS